jgi:hypothetical protein
VYARDKITFNLFLNFKYFIQAMKNQKPTWTLLWPPNFPSLSCGLLETSGGPLRGHMAHLQNHCSIVLRSKDSIYTSFPYMPQASKFQVFRPKFCIHF